MGHILARDWIHYNNFLKNSVFQVVAFSFENSLAYYTLAGKKQTIQKEHINIVEKTAYLDLGNAELPTGNYILEISRGTEVLKTIKVSKNN